MTHSSNPKAPKSSRKKPAREPATIDLKATVIDDGKSPETLQDSQDKIQEPQAEPKMEDVRPEETIAAADEIRPEETVATPEATLDSGAGTDSIGPEVTAQEPPAQETLSPDQSSQDLPPREEPPRAPAARGTSPAALIGSGLLGGLIGAGLVYGFQTLQGPQGQNDQQRLTQLEQRVGALGQQGTPPANLQAVEVRIRELETARTSIDERLQALQGTAEQAAARADEALNRPVPTPPAPQTDTAQTEAALGELSNRLSALEGRVQTATETATGAAQNVTNATNAAQALESRLAELEGRLGEQQQQAADRDRRLSEQEQRAAERDRRLGEQEQRLASLSNQVTEESQGAEAASQAGIRVILSERLGEALRNGSSYAEVLDGLRTAGTEQGRLAPLEPFAQQGAPTATALAQSFESIGATILRNERAASGEWTDRVLRMMDKVVTVRPVNEPDSTGVSSIVARIEQALERGDVAAAATAWETLPEPARRASEEWGRQAKAVAQAHQASQSIATDALAALNQTAQ